MFPESIRRKERKKENNLLGSRRLKASSWRSRIKIPISRGFSSKKNSNELTNRRKISRKGGLPCVSSIAPIAPEYLRKKTGGHPFLLFFFPLLSFQNRKKKNDEKYHRDTLRRPTYDEIFQLESFDRSVFIPQIKGGIHLIHHSSFRPITRLETRKSTRVGAW